MFLDETGATTAMTRLYGWGPCGERLVDAAPAGHWKTTTVVAGLRRTGLIAPCVLDGAMTGAVFRAYVEQMLAPALSPGDVVVLANLQAHKVAGVKEAIRAVGASLLYLPPYSPDFNPIEQLRQAQGAAPEGRRQNTRRVVEHHRSAARRLHLGRVPELHPQLRL